MHSMIYNILLIKDERYCVTDIIIMFCAKRKDKKKPLIYTHTTISVADFCKERRTDMRVIGIYVVWVNERVLNAHYIISKPFHSLFSQPSCLPHNNIDKIALPIEYKVLLWPNTDEEKKNFEEILLKHLIRFLFILYTQHSSHSMRFPFFVLFAFNGIEIYSSFFFMNIGYTLCITVAQI